MIYAAVGQFVVWAFAGALSLVFALDEQTRHETGGKIEPIPSSPISLAVSLVGLVLIAFLAGKLWLPAVLLVGGLSAMLLPRVPRFRLREGTPDA